MEAPDHSLNGNGPHSNSSWGSMPGSSRRAVRRRPRSPRRWPRRSRGKTTVSVERTVLRLLGRGRRQRGRVPLPNVLVDHVRDRRRARRGVAYWVGNAMLADRTRAAEIGRGGRRGELDLAPLGAERRGDPRARCRASARQRLGRISGALARAAASASELGESRRRCATCSPRPATSTRTWSTRCAVAEAGGDIVAVIRSTAQSLLDYVPYGPTTEGYGGTFATQANFRIMREALDEWS